LDKSLLTRIISVTHDKLWGKILNSLFDFYIEENAIEARKKKEHTKKNINKRCGDATLPHRLHSVRPPENQQSSSERGRGKKGSRRRREGGKGRRRWGLA
jgi:hypothetical protein